MSSLKSVITQCPNNKTDECAKFVINDVREEFTLFDIAIVGMKYTFSFWVRSAAAGSIAVNGTTFETSTTWKKQVSTFTAASKDIVFTYPTTGTYYIYHPQLELGTKATDWALAPEDVDENIETVQNTADNAAAGVKVAQSAIQQLADSISMLVRDGDGGSLIHQDSKGLWYFDIGDIEQNISDTASDLDELSGIVRDAEGNIDVLQSLASALAERTEYVRSYTDENDQPCLELGEGDSTFKVKITNTQIQFIDGTSVPAYISNQKLMIEQAEVKDELQFGGFVWKNRTNGNMGLMWTGGENLLVNTHRFMAGTPIVMSSAKVDHYQDSFDGYLLYTPNPIAPGSKVTLQACSDAIWSNTHAGGTAVMKERVGIFVYWCDSLTQATTSASFTTAILMKGDNTTKGRYTWTLTAPAATSSVSNWYVRIRLNIYSDGSTVVTHNFWNIKLENGESAGPWTPNADDVSIW